MDMMHASNLRLPGEGVAEQPPPPVSGAPATEAPTDPSLWRALPGFVSRRNAFLATTAIVICGVAGILYVGVSQPGPADFGLQMEAPAVAATPTSSPTLDRYGAVPAAPQPVAVLAETSAPAVPQAAPPPAPVPAAPVAASPAPVAAPDPLAEQRQLLQQATAPIVAPVAAPAPNEEVGKLSAMMTSVSALLSEVSKHRSLCAEKSGSCRPISARRRPTPTRGSHSWRPRSAWRRRSPSLRVQVRRQ